MLIVAESRMDREQNGTGPSYGVYQTSPRPNPLPLPGQDQTNKAACVEFKCAGNIYSQNALQINDVSTFVTVNLPNRTCRLL